MHAKCPSLLTSSSSCYDDVWRQSRYLYPCAVSEIMRCLRIPSQMAPPSRFRSSRPRVSRDLASRELDETSCADGNGRQQNALLFWSEGEEIASSQRAADTKNKNVDEFEISTSRNVQSLISMRSDPNSSDWTRDQTPNAVELPLRST